MAEEEFDGSDESFLILVESLTAQLHRLPTEDEVVKFIFGTKEERELIWNGQYNG